MEEEGDWRVTYILHTHAQNVSQGHAQGCGVQSPLGPKVYQTLLKGSVTETKFVSSFLQALRPRDLTMPEYRSNKTTHHPKSTYCHHHFTFRFILPGVGLATRPKAERLWRAVSPWTQSLRCPKGFHNFGCINKVKPYTGRLFSRSCPRLLRGQWRVIPSPRLK